MKSIPNNNILISMDNTKDQRNSGIWKITVLISGYRVLYCHRIKTPIKRKPVINVNNAKLLLHPLEPASIVPYETQNKPIPESKIPIKSTVDRCSPRDSGKKKITATPANAIIGTFNKKIHPHQT